MAIITIFRIWYKRKFIDGGQKIPDGYEDGIFFGQNALVCTDWYEESLKETATDNLLSGSETDSIIGYEELTIDSDI